MAVPNGTGYPASRAIAKGARLGPGGGVMVRRKERITDRFGRPPNFPYDGRLERLLLNYDPGIGYFKLSMKRRNARDLRRELFGPRGLQDVPDEYGGVMKFGLPNGWRLRLTYYEQEYDYEKCHLAAGDVDAEFIPPARREERSISRREPASQAQAHL